MVGYERMGMMMVSWFGRSPWMMWAVSVVFECRRLMLSLLLMALMLRSINWMSKRTFWWVFLVWDGMLRLMVSLSISQRRVILSFRVLMMTLGYLVLACLAIFRSFWSCGRSLPTLMLNQGFGFWGYTLL